MNFAVILDHASNRYRPCGQTAHRFARGKLRGDPVYRAVIEGGLLPRDGSVLDLGCGGGLMLAVLASARVLSPVSDSSTRRLLGVESRPKAAEIARGALGNEAVILTDDVRRCPLPSARAILLFDVLNLMPAGDQDALLAAVLASLEPGGILLVREADADAGWRFRAVRAGNWIKACWVGRFAQAFHFRPLAAWRRWLEQAGLDVEVRPMGMGTPFGNVLLVARKRGRVGAPA